MFTGKTYNSMENISQFFQERGVSFPKPPPPPQAPPPPPQVKKPLPTAPAGAPKKVRAGQTVKHPKYGTGVVVRREGEGDDAKITVSFPRYGLKKLIERFAGLTNS
jgi:DNA helicase-2/ATP-dependent DNA helicase PcrA